MKRFAFAVLVLVTIAVPAMAQDIDFEVTILEIETLGGETHTFQVEVAGNNAERAQGLMFREEMADDAGMLFVYPRPKLISMWMQNTILSLDMIFIDSDGEIIRIAENTIPYSTATVGSGGLAQYVLEVKAGTSARLGIAPGDRVSSPAMQLD